MNIMIQDKYMAISVDNIHAINFFSLLHLQVLYNAAWEMGKQRYFGRDSFK